MTFKHTNENNGHKISGGNKCIYNLSDIVQSKFSSLLQILLNILDLNFYFFGTTYKVIYIGSKLESISLVLM